LRKSEYLNCEFIDWIFRDRMWSTHFYCLPFSVLQDVEIFVTIFSFFLNLVERLFQIVLWWWFLFWVVHTMFNIFLTYYFIILNLIYEFCGPVMADRETRIQTIFLFLLTGFQWLWLTHVLTLLFSCLSTLKKNEWFITINFDLKLFYHF
jgi:hypothetical protein